MDFGHADRLRGGMAEQDPSLAHDDLIRQLFYLLTARFEDGASAAAHGQAAGIAPNARVERANRLHSLAQEVMILSEAVIALSGARDEPVETATG